MLGKDDTKFMKDLRLKLINVNKLTAGTVNLYITKLKKLNMNNSFNTFSFLKNTKGITELLNKYENDNTRKSYIASIVSVLNYSDMKQYKNINSYYKSIMEKEKALFDNKPKNEMNDKQKENWITWDDVKNIHNEMKDKIDKLTPELLESSKSTRDLYEEYILLSLYVKYPPRRNADYYLMKIDNDNKMDEDFNYYRPKTKTFVFHQFKTVKSYGPEKLPVNNTLSKILNKYIEILPLHFYIYYFFIDKYMINNNNNNNNI
jgi:hypothetical protein